MHPVTTPTVPGRTRLGELSFLNTRLIHVDTAAAITTNKVSDGSMAALAAAYRYGNAMISGTAQNAASHGLRGGCVVVADRGCPLGSFGWDDLAELVRAGFCGDGLRCGGVRAGNALCGTLLVVLGAWSLGSPTWLSVTGEGRLHHGHAVLCSGYA